MNFLKVQEEMKKLTSQQQERMIDSWIKQHVSDSPERTHDGSPMAAISVSVRYDWAKKAEVELDVVNERVNSLCRVVSPDTEPELDSHCVADRFRLRR